MKSKVIRIHQASRSLEYVAFLGLKLSIKEGPAFAFWGVDAYSQFVFSTGVEPNENSDTILKQIYLLTEHEDFIKHIDRGFTLVLSEYKNLEDKIKSIITSVNGRVIYDSDFHKEIISPVLESFREHLGEISS